MFAKYGSSILFTIILTTMVAFSVPSAQAVSGSHRSHSICQNFDFNSHSNWFSYLLYRYWSRHCDSEQNVKPTADAGQNQTVDSGQTVTLNGSASQDPDGNIVKYQWRLIGQSPWRYPYTSKDNLIGRDAAIATFSPPISTRTRYYFFRLTITDNSGARSTDYVKIKVRAAPKVTIEGGDEFESEELISLNAVLRKPKRGVSYQWTQLSGSSATFQSPTTQANVTIVLPRVSETEELVFQVRAKRANRKPIYATKTITVNKPAIPLSTVSGRIMSVAGSAVSNAKITAMDKAGLTTDVIAQTNVNGEFSIDLIADTDYVLRLTELGYGNKVIPIQTPSVGSEFTLNGITMAPRNDAQTISTVGQQTVEAIDGASVTFDKASFVDSDGQPLQGDMQLTITSIDVSNTRSISAFPGLFLGTSDTASTPELIVSLGATEFHFTHNGEAVTLASGATADIQIPIYVNEYPNGSPIEVGQTTTLRSLNEDSGLWTQEGVGTIVYSDNSPTGLAYQATVSHFSWWGSDVAISTPPGDTTPNTGVANVIINVIAPPGIQGTAVIEATAPGLSNWRGSSVSIAVEIGESSPTLSIPANREVCFTALLYYDSGATGQTNEVCVNEASEATVNLDITIGIEGPLDVDVTPQTAEDTAFIQGFEDVQSPALRIAPSTIETTVTYLLFSGTLPAGLSLDVFDNVLNIIGVPTTVGQETFVIRATDEDGFTDDVTITYDVSAIDPPPIIEADLNRFFVGEITTPGGTVSVNLNDMVSNIGGSISQWREVTSTTDQTECINMYASAGLKGPSADLLLPASATLATFTGELTFDAPGFWLSCLLAFNNRGTDVFMFGFEVIDTSL